MYEFIRNKTVASSLHFLPWVPPAEHTCVLRPDRKSALIGWKNLQFDAVCGAGQQLRGLHQGAVLGVGPVYGQDDVAYVQGSTPEAARVGGGSPVS